MCRRPPSDRHLLTPLGLLQSLRRVTLGVVVYFGSLNSGMFASKGVEDVNGDCLVACMVLEGGFEGKLSPGS